MPDRPPQWCSRLRAVIALSCLSSLGLLAPKGDIAIDGSIDVRDVLTLERALQGLVTLSSEQQDAADVSLVASGATIGNGMVDTGDLEVLRRVVFGLGSANGTDLGPNFALSLGLSPFSADSNANGINDGQEDPDADGLSNRREQWLGRNPLNAYTSGGTIPDGRALAPTLALNHAADLVAANQYLFTGTDPIQRDVTATFDPARIAVIRGRIRSVTGTNLPGVTVSILGHPEYGTTKTLADGEFDLVVNGGGLLTLVYASASHLESRRTVAVPWRDYLTVAEVKLLARDTGGTGTLALSAGSQTAQVWRGTAVTDPAGTRRPTLIFQPGTTASATAAGQSIPTSLPNVTVRTTETTEDVETEGSTRLPLPLPPGADPIYVAEFSVLEAVALGAEHTEFQNTDPQLENAPVVFYLENFLNYPEGLVIENATLSSAKTAWVPEGEPGRAIKIVSIDTSGTPAARVDTDGDGQADDAGLGLAERQGLAAVPYAAGQRLMRFPLRHFSFGCPHVDFAWPDDVQEPNPPLPVSPVLPDCTPGCGSILDLENQVLKERVSVQGTPWALHYSSERTPGYDAAYAADIPYTGPEAPGSVEEVTVNVEVAGRIERFRHVNPNPGQPFPSNQVLPYEWDEKTNIYGQTLQGRQPLRAQITWWFKPKAAIRPDGTLISGATTRGLGGRSQYYETFIGPWDNRAQGLGGWSLTPVHSYDERGSTLYRGDGERVSAESLPAVVRRATKVNLVEAPSGLVVAADGAIYTAEPGLGAFGTSKVGRIIAGDRSNFAGHEPICPSGGNPPPATPVLASKLCLKNVHDVALGPDGSLVVADSGGNRVWRITAPLGPESIATVVAGTGLGSGTLNDGAPAATARVATPWGIDVAPDGTLFIAAEGRIRRVMPNGIIVTAAGIGTDVVGTCPVISGAPIRATGALANIPNMQDVAVGPDGSLFIAAANEGCQRIYRVTTDGFMTQFAGLGPSDPTGGLGDGGPALAARLSWVSGIAVGRDGSVYIAQQPGTSGGHRIRRVAPDGIITSVIGDGVRGVSEDGVPALRARVGNPGNVALDAFGRLHFPSSEQGGSVVLVARIEPALTSLRGGDCGTTTVCVPSGDGSEIYEFNAAGMHLKTYDATRNSLKLTMAYAADRLVSVTDVFGNVTTIERDASGKPLRITGPFGDATELVLDSAGWLSRIEDGADQAFVMTSDTSGLLATFKTPNQHVYSYEYDTAGRLVVDNEPVATGGFQTLSRTNSAPDALQGWSVRRTTALLRDTHYGVMRLASGVQRRTVTDAAGLVTQRDRDLANADTRTSPTGMVTTRVPAADPRLGFTAAFDGRVGMLSPAGRQLQLSRTRSSTFGTEGVLTAQTDNVQQLLGPGQTLAGTSTSQYSSTAAVTWNGNSSGKRTTTSFGGRVLEEAIDPHGRMVGARLGSLHSVRLSHDTRGRVSELRHGPGGTSDRVTTLTYHPTTGRLTSVTDGSSRTTTFDVYDASARLRQMTLPGGRVVTLAYDANGNLTSLTPPGRPAHVFRYSAIDQEKEYEPPAVSGITDTRTLSSYDLDRQLDFVARPDTRTLDPGYEAATGRLQSLVTKVGPSAETSRSFAYYATNGGGGAAGELSGVVDVGGVTLGYAYDGSLPTGTTWSGTVAGAVTRSFDDAFRVSTETAGGSTVSFGYDADGLLHSAVLSGGPTLTVARDPALGFGSGTITGTTLGQVQTHVLPTAFGELAEERATIGGTERYKEEILSRDGAGRILGRRETVEGVVTTYGYTYDPAGRLDVVTVDGTPVRDYDYDLNGNRTHVNALPVASYDAQDRLTVYGSTTFTYTEAGDLATRVSGGQTTTYVYDSYGSLRSVARPSPAPLVEYVIDGESRRVGKKVGGTLVKGFLYADALRVVAELDGSQAPVSRFVYGTKPNVPDWMIRGGQAYRIVSDHLGSVRLVIDAADPNPATAVVQQMAYDEWGNVTLDSNPGFQPFGFAGGLYDSDTGLVRFGARDYDPSVGRWTSKDPIRFDGGANSYAYVEGDPINLTDPTGLEANKAVGVVIAVRGLPSRTYSVGGEDAAVAAVTLGSAVRFGDVLVTDAGESIQIKLIDDTLFFIGENSELVVDDFVYKSLDTLEDFFKAYGIGACRYIRGRFFGTEPPGPSSDLGGRRG